MRVPDVGLEVGRLRKVAAAKLAVEGPDTTVRQNMSVQLRRGYERLAALVARVTPRRAAGERLDAGLRLLEGFAPHHATVYITVHLEGLGGTGQELGTDCEKLGCVALLEKLERT
jgi:hypothetical protein